MNGLTAVRKSNSRVGSGMANSGEEKIPADIPGEGR